MAHIANPSLPADRPTVGTRIASFLVRMMEARAQALGLERRHAQLQRLLALDDAELARIGLTRSGLPAHVFRDLMIL